MNISKALRLMRLAIDLDKAKGITAATNELRKSLDSLVSTPSDPNAQTQVRQHLDRWANGVSEALSETSAADMEGINELGGGALFNPNTYGHIVEHMNANLATPAVTRDYVAQLISQRAMGLTHFEQILSSFSSLELDDGGDEEWEAEVGFTIPRKLFENSFEGLLGELRFIRRFMRDLSETEGLSDDELQLASLSTTDPTVVIGVATVIAIKVGIVVTWALNAWEKFERIRKLRAETEQTKAFTQKEMADFFDEKIKLDLKTQVASEAQKLAMPVADVGRRNELTTAFAKHLEQLLARIERGMTVEIRLLNAPAAPDEGGDDTDDESPITAEHLSLVNGLRFPPPSATPVLKLEDGGGGSDAEAPAKKQGQARARSKPASS